MKRAQFLSHSADNDFRQLLCDYVKFLLLTGARHGTEAMGGCWQHCECYIADGVKYLRVWMDGNCISNCSN